MVRIRRSEYHVSSLVADCWFEMDLHCPLVCICYYRLPRDTCQDDRSQCSDWGTSRFRWKNMMTMLTLVFKLLNIPWTGTGIGVSNPTPEKIARGCGNVRFVHTLVIRRCLDPTFGRYDCGHPARVFHASLRHRNHWWSQSLTPQSTRLQRIGPSRNPLF